MSGNEDNEVSNVTGVLQSMDPSKINPYGAEEKDVSNYRQAQLDALEALQKRYEKPNWFKIAAGFAKPQLGGFFANLGSANEAYGEQVEKRRENAVNIALLKSQMAQSNILMGQNQKQSDILNQWQSQDHTPTPQEISNLIALNPNSKVASSINQLYPNISAKQNIETTTARAVRDYPELLKTFLNKQLMDPNDAKSHDEYLATLNQGKPPEIDAATWQALPAWQKQELVLDYANDQKERGLNVEDKLRESSAAAPERINLLNTIRDKALGVGLPDVEKDGKKITGQEQMNAVLQYFGSGSLFDAVAKAFSDGNMGGLFANVEQYARQAGMSKAVSDNFQELAKLLAQNQAQIRGMTTNPTDQFTALQQAGSPNVNNSQKALVSIVDLMAHTEKIQQEKYKFIKEHKIPYGQLEYNQDYLDMMKQLGQDHLAIAAKDPFMNAPNQYDPAASSVKPKPVAPSSAQNRSDSRTFNTGNWVRQPDGSYKKAP